MSDSASFIANWLIWRDAVMVSVISAALLGYLGVWVVLKRVIYVPLALAQVSSVGVVTAFLLADFTHVWLDTTSDLHDVFNPAAMALVFALLASFFFARRGSNSDESVVTAYLVGSAVALILGGFVRQDFHDLQSVLFGSAVLVETVQIFYVGAAALIVALLHAFYFRRFLFVSFDPDSAGASGISVVRTEMLLYGSVGIMISVATRAIGALPAFGFIVLPALLGLRLGRSMRSTGLIAVVVATVAAVVGYYASWVLELPTGACMVAVAAILYGLGMLAPGRGRVARV
ncbi:MAG: metal ABC transporter permease [Myxococcota bacterium]